MSNKDIFILENKKEDIANYIINNNKKSDTTRSQKYINNRSLGETINITTKKEKKINKYSSVIENNSVYSEKQIKQIKYVNSNKDVSKTEKK